VTDLEIVKACAKAMGFKVASRPAGVIVAYQVSESAIVASNARGGDSVYDPLTDKAQCFDLVEELRLHINDMQDGNTRAWGVFPGALGGLGIYDRNLARAICTCVAKMKE